MDLSTTQQILLVILGSALAVFLVLAIVVIILVIRLLATIKLITTKAEKLIESAEAVGQVFKKASGPVGIFNVIKGAFDMVQQHKRSNKE
jgi:hypothetical protein